MKMVFDLFSFLIQVVTEFQGEKKGENGVFNYVTCFSATVRLDKACGTKSCVLGDKLQVRYEPPRP